MDGNGHSSVWGPCSVGTNQVGYLLENLLASETLFPLNSLDSLPTYVGDDRRSSWIYVSVVSFGLLERIYGWVVEEEAYLGSDHTLISWELSVRPQTFAGPRVHNWLKVNWTEFNRRLVPEMLSLSSVPMKSPKQLNQAVTRLTEVHQTMAAEYLRWRRVCQFPNIGGLHRFRS